MSKTLYTNVLALADHHTALCKASAGVLIYNGHLFYCFGRPNRDDCTEEDCLALRRALTNAWPSWPGAAKEPETKEATDGPG